MKDGRVEGGNTRLQFGKKKKVKKFKPLNGFTNSFEIIFLNMFA